MPGAPLRFPSQDHVHRISRHWFYMSGSRHTSAALGMHDYARFGSGVRMTARAASDFYAAEAERLIQQAAATVERDTRLKLLEMAYKLRQLANRADAHPDAANRNEKSSDSKTG